MTAPKGWRCSARSQGSTAGHHPADCGWPFCGCDPYAAKVLAALEESGVSLTSAPSPPARETAEMVAALEALDYALDAFDAVASQLQYERPNRRGPVNDIILKVKDGAKVCSLEDARAVRDKLTKGRRALAEPVGEPE